ncbi:hypothetical protein GH714_027061 [Hevea brasiliensis]|uniref:Wall-associated receptor kinase galacturonan-binding domain-containing protein n=1 Tax=Hevea brasiliensis TaxID=3981 RepID=A0A6A6LKQ9_HEVBR|nr:hypothetical protein GH714_027061 [Hevea brasiliensis]
MSVKFVSQVSLSLALLLTIQLAIAKGPIAKPSCTDHCGNIDIPYPFGMGEKDCYFNEWFEIECNESRAFISKIKMELLNISTVGRANVKSPIISSDCSDRVSDLPFNLTGSPFFISDYNVFTAVGCNTRALMIDQSLQRLGCYNTFIPSGFNASFQAINDQSTDGCKLAFLAGTYGWNSWRKKDPNVQFPMVLDWMLYSNRTVSYNWMISSGLWSGNNSESESLYCIYVSSSIMMRQQYSVVNATVGMRAILTFDAQCVGGIIGNSLWYSEVVQAYEEKKEHPTQKKVL